MFARFLVVLCAMGPMVYFQISECRAQKQEAKVQVEKLFDSFLRRGDFPLKFKVSVYRTSRTGLGAHIGSIVASNSMITIADRKEPALVLKANLTGLQPGAHAFHIHENPDCGPKEKDGVMVPGLAAGAHLFAEYNTGGIEPVTLICKSHLGNLPNLTVNQDGTSTEEIIVPRLALADLVNRSIMVHETKDDTSSREACGTFK
jgi:superoxide dismutase, Cu-Zn family